MDVTVDGFGWMGEALASVAERHASGRIILALEGGYDLPSLESGLLAAIQGVILGRTFNVDRAPDHPDVGKAERAIGRARTRA
jgi:acetoin utilization deacetylase AcuC-like enzyme